VKLISKEKDYIPIAIGIKKTIHKEKKIPQRVFRKSFKYFLFITFEEIFMPLFFNNVKRYLRKKVENSFWITVIDPDPKDYFESNFDFFGTIEFCISDTIDDYLSALNDYPASSPADALAHNSNILIFSSYQNNWAIYGDRESDIAVCAFSDSEQMELFNSTYESGLLEGIKAASEYAYNEKEEIPFKNEFYNNYK